ncbi:MAG: hypothetical protein H6739_29285 [Alphaproteobacteria bacterium]|nr:hypothetical protein [Alphaproteobacteria bacterium]
MTFQMIACVMTLAGSVLGLRFIFAGASILEEWAIEPTQGALIVCRRLGALYLGLAGAFFLGRTAEPSELRTALCLGIGAASAALAALGIFELVVGRVQRRVLISVTAEVLLAGALVWVALSGA